MASVCAFVLTRNRRELLVECVRGLLAQTRPPERIVVLDNASTDGTAAHLEAAGLLAEPSVVFERSEENTGGAGGYARGVELSLAQGTDWIWLMDDDAEPRPDALERLLAAPEAGDPGVAVLANAVEGPDGEIDVMHRCDLGRFMRPLPLDVYRDGVHPAIAIASFVGFMVRSDAARAVGLPRADFFIGCDDVEYSLRVRSQGRLHLVPESRILHKFQMAGGTATRRSRFWNRVLGTPYPAVPWTGYWKTLYGIRNFVWVKHHYEHPSLADDAAMVAAYAGKALLFDERPLRRIPWILRYAAKGRRGDLTGVTPEEWARIASEDDMTAPTDTPKAPHTGPRQLFTREAVRSFRRNPRFFLANLAQGPQWLLDTHRRQVPRDTYAEHFVAERDAVAAVLGVDPAEYDAALAKLWRPQPDPDEPLSVWNAREELLNLVGTVVALMRPAVMVETGVALGFTTATVLTAMRENGHGHLYSVDLPAIQYDPDEAVGREVPEDVRDRWTLTLGPSQRVLPGLVARVAPLDVFLHDANHAYGAQLFEYRTAWPHLRSGGVLLSDDVGNPAFVEFAESVGARPYLIPSETHEGVVGILRKP